ncbi:hypothetical protein OEA41_004562 [Lepraria neglecta]|uniref:Clr5 domain-containing protein n=1 Tax=Lepraria neglecta TaxID=209136 RepID=A0AAE0DFW1_9LECA|nr:hypothetical protein OEA41_004562 [Lepraria neglecta]
MTSTTFAIPSLPHQGNIPYYSHDSHAQNDDFMLFGDIYTESGHGSPKNTSTSHDFLQSQYPGTVTSDNSPVDSSFIALEAQQDAVPSGFLMSHPYQGTAHIGTPTSMPPPAPPILSSPVAESESEALSSTRRSEKEWLSNRENIRKLYMDENCTLTSTMKTMKERYGFNASSKRYKEKLKEWGFDKNLTRRQSKFIRDKTLRRHNEQGKKTEFRIRGSVVPQNKVERALKAAPESELSHTATSPSEIAYGTPGMLSSQSAPQSPFVLPQSPIFTRRSRSSLPRDEPAVDTLASTLGLEWHGHGLDELRDLRDRAVGFTENGEHEEARAAFVEALCGFEALVGPSHTDTIRALSSYVEFCIAQEDFDEAKDRLQKSLAHHQAQHGNNHQTTLQSMGRLGRFFKWRNQYGRSEILLIKAKIGLESLYKSDAEELYQNTRDVASDLIEVFRMQGNLEGAEQEYLSLISRLEALRGPQLEPLQSPYHTHLTGLQRNLIYLYVLEWTRNVGSPRKDLPYQKVERWLLNSIETLQLSPKTAKYYWENYYLLLRQYLISGEESKLKSLVELIEDKINLAGDAAWPYPVPACRDRKFDSFFTVRECMALSYLRFGNGRRADWWLTRLQNEVEGYFGADSQEAIFSIVRRALFHLRRDHWEEAEPLFHEAQRRAGTGLELDDRIRAKVSKCLVDHQYESPCIFCKVPCKIHRYPSSVEL